MRRWLHDCCTTTIRHSDEVYSYATAFDAAVNHFLARYWVVITVLDRLKAPQSAHAVATKKRRAPSAGCDLGAELPVQTGAGGSTGSWLCGREAALLQREYGCDTVCIVPNLHNDAIRHETRSHFADLHIDTSTSAGEMRPTLSPVHSERRLISQRTRGALAAKHARGWRLGRRRLYPSR